MPTVSRRRAPLGGLRGGFGGRPRAPGGGGGVQPGGRRRSSRGVARSSPVAVGPGRSSSMSGSRGPIRAAAGETASRPDSSIGDVRSARPRHRTRRAHRLPRSPAAHALDDRLPGRADAGAGWSTTARTGSRSGWRAVPSSAYVGFDASGPSLHVGHLVPLFALVHLQRHGGRPVARRRWRHGHDRRPVGQERRARAADRRTRSTPTRRRIRVQLERFLDFDAGPAQARMVDNREWLDASTACSTTCGTSASTSPSPRCWRRTPSSSASAAACRSPSSAIRPFRRPTSCTCTATTGSRCRWAAPTSGATSRPASRSSGA